MTHRFLRHSHKIMSNMENPTANRSSCYVQNYAVYNSGDKHIKGLIHIIPIKFPLL